MTQKPDDVLHAATRALRDETVHESSAARFTRLRVMASLRESEVRRRTQTVLLLPFAACLAVASAWGMAVGGITEMRTAVVDALGLDTPPSEPSAPNKPNQPNKPNKPNKPNQPNQNGESNSANNPGRAVVPVDSAPPLPAPAPAPALTPTPPPTSATLTPAPAEKRSFSSASTAPRSLPNAPPHVAPRDLARKGAAAPPALSAPDPAHELYRAAHRAHFTDHDCDRALSGWDAYLAASPRGPLAVEARYNRALCLVRLGRAEEARRALRPFATAPGGYRQKEASALLTVVAEN